MDEIKQQLRNSVVVYSFSNLSRHSPASAGRRRIRIPHSLQPHLPHKRMHAERKDR